MGVARCCCRCCYTCCYAAKILGRIQAASEHRSNTVATPEGRLSSIQEYVPPKKLRDGPGAYTIYGFHDMGELVFGEYGKLLISVSNP
jgi:hypothetical protein